jgi:hypothetical protein
MVAQRHSKRPGRRAQSRRVLPKNKGNSMVSSWALFHIVWASVPAQSFPFFPRTLFTHVYSHNPLFV